MVADARGTSADLQAQLEVQLRERYWREDVHVINVDIRHGSLIVEIALALGALAGALSLYGSARTGLDRLVRDVVSVCEFFLRQFGDYVPEVQGVSWRWSGAPVRIAGPMLQAVNDQAFLRLLTYLIVSHAMLLIGLIVVLLIEVT